MLKRILVLLCLVLPLMAACGDKLEKRDDFYNNAQTAFEAGNYTEAKLDVRNAIKIDNKYAPAWALLGDILFQEKEFRQAFLNFTRATEEDPNNVRGHFGLARLYSFTRGETAKAEEHLDTVLRLEPNHLQALALKATMAGRKGDIETAMALVEKVLDLDPTTTEAYLVKADIHVSQKDMPKAYAVLDEGKTRAKNIEPIMLKYGLLAMQEKNFDKAAEVYRELVQNNPDNDAYKLYLANALNTAGKQGEAADIIEALTKKDPENQEYRITHARLIAASGDMDGAQVVLEKAMAGISEPYKVVESLAQLYLSTGQQEKAMELLQTYIAKDTEQEHAGTVPLVRMLASLLAMRGEYDQAQVQADNLLQRNPKDVQGLLLRGRLFSRDGEYLKAIGDFRTALDEQPELHEARMLLARAHFLNKEPFSAVEELEKILAQNPAYLPAREALSRYYLSEGKMDRVRTQIMEVAKIQPQNPTPWVYMGDSYLLEKKPEEAIKAYKDALERFPAQPGIRTKIAMVHARNGDMAKAREWLEEDLTVQGDYLPALQGLSQLDLRENKKTQALKRLQKASDQYPDNVRLLALKGEWEALNGNYGQARKDFTQAIEKQPKFGEAYLSLARIYASTDKLDEGIGHFSEAVEKDPDNLTALYMVGLLHEQKGDVPATIDSYRKLLEKQPNFLPAANNLAYLLAQNAQSPKDLEEALQLAELAAQNESAQTLDTLGTVQLSMGQSQQALETFLKALEKAPDHPSVLFHLGRTYAMMGDNAKAKDYLSKALETGKDFDEKKDTQDLLKSLQ